MPLSVQDYLALPAVRADHVLRYGEGPDAFGELHLPPGAGPHPAAIVLHGGCWQAAYGLAPLGPLCAALARSGIAAWNLEYRRIGDGGGWPGTFADVAAGADFLAKVAPRLGLDLARVIAIGHSAGGQLALWLAARTRTREGGAAASAPPLALCGVVSLAGLADLEEAWRLRICGEACAELLGGPPERVPERYRETSPAALLPLGVPHVHVVGREDDTVPPEYVRRFVERAVRAGDPARIEELEGAGHFEPVDPRSTAWLSVRDAAFGLLSPDAPRGEWQGFRRGT